jgi:hypothetical protein
MIEIFSSVFSQLQPFINLPSISNNLQEKIFWDSSIPLEIEHMGYGFQRLS